MTIRSDIVLFESCFVFSSSLLTSFVASHSTSSTFVKAVILAFFSARVQIVPHSSSPLTQPLLPSHHHPSSQTLPLVARRLSPRDGVLRRRRALGVRRGDVVLALHAAADGLWRRRVLCDVGARTDEASLWFFLSFFSFGENLSLSSFSCFLSFFQNVDDIGTTLSKVRSAAGGALCTFSSHRIDLCRSFVFVSTPSSSSFRPPSHR